MLSCLCLQVQEAMYGQAAGGFFGYSHLTGGYQGGQADFVRVPFGESWQQCCGRSSSSCNAAAAALLPARLRSLNKQVVEKELL